MKLNRLVSQAKSAAGSALGREAELSSQWGWLPVLSVSAAGGLLIMREFEPNSKLVLFTGIDKCKFRKQVTPGDQLRIEVEVLAFRRSVSKGIPSIRVLRTDGQPGQWTV